MRSTRLDLSFGQDGAEPPRARLRHNIIGVEVTAIDYEGVCEAIFEAVKLKRSLTVSALAVHGVMTGSLNRQHRQRLNALDMLVPDGQPVRWALNLLFRAGLRDRVYGPSLMLRICERAEMLGFVCGLLRKPARSIG